VLITAIVFYLVKNPTFVFFYDVLYSAKLHYESKYEESLEKIESFDFLFLISFYFSPSSIVDFKPKIWIVPLSLLQANQFDLRS